MSYNLTTMQSIFWCTKQYYISPVIGSNPIFVNLTPNYTVRNTTKIKYTFVPGTFVEDTWVGHCGIVPSYDNWTPNTSNDFRLFSYTIYGNCKVGVHNQETQISTIFTYSTAKRTVEMWDYGINVWDENNSLIETHTWTPGETWDSGIGVYLFPATKRTDGGTVVTNQLIKLYSVIVTDDVLGTIYNGTVDNQGLYDSVSQTYTTITGWKVDADKINEKAIATITHNGSIVYDKTQTDEPFYIENLTNSLNKVYIKASGDAPELEIYKSYDNSTFTLAGNTGDTGQVTINVPAKSKVWLRCTANTWCNTTASSSDSNYIYADYEFAVGGNIMSLLYGADYLGKTSFPTTGSNTFRRMFAESNIKDASKLVLPVTNLGTFKSQYCYSQMFQNCIDLEYAPALPATTLSRYCYYQMFEGCESLISTPLLPARTIQPHSYDYMFNYCTSLETVICLADSGNGGTNTVAWLDGVNTYGIFYAATTYGWTRGSSGVPTYWYTEYYDPSDPPV